MGKTITKQIAIKDDADKKYYPLLPTAEQLLESQFTLRNVQRAHAGTA